MEVGTSKNCYGSVQGFEKPRQVKKLELPKDNDDRTGNFMESGLEKDLLEGIKKNKNK